MGNYGNTVDRWYRRAAVVVWPKEKSFAARAEAGSAWALWTLMERIDAGDLDGARVDATSLEPFWSNLEPGALAPALQVAVRLVDPTIARMVVAPFRLEMLRAGHAPLLAELARTYGDPWLLDLLDSWDSADRRSGQDRLAWITKSLPAVCRRLRKYGADPIAAG